MNFIKKIFEGDVDESVHKQFVRFGKGDYSRRAILSYWKTKKIKIKSSFEFANDLVLSVADLGEVSFKGDIWSREEISFLEGGVKKSGKWIYNVRDLKSSDVKDLEKEVYYFLLDGEGEGIKLKIKKKLPKPGKNEDKFDNKFCQLELDPKYENQIKSDFFWDIPEFKKVSINHTFSIKEIVMPQTDEKDFSIIREMAKRKGKIIRKAVIDGEEKISEIDFEA